MKYLSPITNAARNHYDGNAEKYAETDLEKESFKGFQVFGEKLKSLCGRVKPVNVIELGVGTGRYFPYAFGNGLFVGIDISSQMVEQARQRLNILRINGFKEIRLIEGDLLGGSRLIEEKFDLVYAIGVLGYHLPLNKNTIGVLKSLLTPGGLFSLPPSSSQWLDEPRPR